MRRKLRGAKVWTDDLNDDNYDSENDISTDAGESEVEGNPLASASAVDSDNDDPDWEPNTALLNMERDQEDLDVAASFYSRVHTRGAKRTVRKKKRDTSKSQRDSDALAVYAELKEETRWYRPQ